MRVRRDCLAMNINNFDIYYVYIIFLGIYNYTTTLNYFYSNKYNRTNIFNKPLNEAFLKVTDLPGKTHITTRAYNSHAKPFYQ